MKIFPIFSVLFVLLVGCHQAPAPSAMRAQNDVFWMSPEDRSVSEKKALAGDAKAAVALAFFYNYYSHNRDLGIRWTRTAAILGDKPSKLNIAFFLIQRARSEDRAEAIDWLVAARKDGNKLAKERLLELISEK